MGECIASAGVLLMNNNMTTLEKKQALEKAAKSKIFEDIFGPIDLESDEGKALLSRQSLHAEEFNDLHYQELKMELSKLGELEKMEDKMRSIKVCRLFPAFQDTPSLIFLMFHCTVTKS